MTWFGWCLIAIVALSTLLSVAQIGKKREPLDPSTVVVIVIVNSLLILGTILVGTNA